MGIKLDATQVVAVAAFLRVLNALENIRQSIELLHAGARQGFFRRAPADALLARAGHETEDAIRVLSGAGLHPRAVAHLEDAARLTQKARHSYFRRGALIERAARAQEQARAELVAEAAAKPTQRRD